MGGDGGGKVVRGERIVPARRRQLPLHSMSYGLRDGSTARSLRAEIMSFIRANPTLSEISDTPLKDWVKWDTGSSVTSYTAKMAMGGWGGGIEMAAAARLKRVNVEVYETCAAGFKRISVSLTRRARGATRRRPRAPLARSAAFLAAVRCRIGAGVRPHAYGARSPLVGAPSRHSTRHTARAPPGVCHFRCMVHH